MATFGAEILPGQVGHFSRAYLGHFSRAPKGQHLNAKLVHVAAKPVDGGYGLLFDVIDLAGRRLLVGHSKQPVAHVCRHRLESFRCGESLQLCLQLWLNSKVETL